jgi:hypothetical protein
VGTEKSSLSDAHGKASKKSEPGHDLNELSLLRYMLNVAVDEGYKATVRAATS